MNPLPNYAEGIPDEMLLGHIAWYSITSPEVTHSQLLEMVSDLPIDTRILPPPPRLGDAFKRACRYSEAQGLTIPQSENLANFLIRKVQQTATEIERHLVLEIVDPEGRTLQYLDTVHLRFDRSDQKLHVRKLQDLSPELDAMVLRQINVFAQNFDRASKFLDAQVLRLMVRDQLALMKAIPVRPQGSVYFIPMDEKVKTEALEVLLPRFGGGSHFHALPLVNTAKQREMIRAAFEAEVHENVTTIIATVNRIRDEKRQITQREWDDLRKRYSALKESANDYAALVDFELQKTKVGLESVNDLLVDMLTGGLVKV